MDEDVLRERRLVVDGAFRWGNGRGRDFFLIHGKNLLKLGKNN